MRRQSHWLLAVLVFAGTGACTSADGAPLMLELRDLDTERGIVKRVALPPDGAFALRFTHSMFGGAVEEAFHVQWKSEVGPVLVRSGVRADHAGAAEYYARYGNTRRDGSGWIVDVAPLTLTHLAVRVDRVGDPSVVVDGVGEGLLKSVPDGHLVELRAVASGRP